MSYFKPATKDNCKLRLAIFGVSGSGKTMSALRMAKGLGSKIAVIDTERGSASKYSGKVIIDGKDHIFKFDVANPEKPTINNLKMFIDSAKDYDVLIIDSMTHAWLELLQEVEQIARSKFNGNTWSAWSEGTPKQMSLINALLSFPGHIIATMRVETNWTTITNEKGKIVPVRIGEAPKQGKGIEYEFDMLMQMSQEHTALIIKDRTSRYQDQIIEKPDEDFGKELANWLNEGIEIDPHKDSAEHETGVPGKEPEKIPAKETKKTNKKVETKTVEQKTYENPGQEFTNYLKTKGLKTRGQLVEFAQFHEISSSDTEKLTALLNDKDEFDVMIQSYFMHLEVEKQKKSN